MSATAVDLTVRAATFNRGLTLVEQIENFIIVRDNFWKELVGRELVEERDIELLETANESLRKMLDLTPGPTTPVLDPLTARREHLRCGICAVFVSIVKREISGRDTTTRVDVLEAVRQHAGLRFVKASLELALPEGLDNYGG